MEMRMSVFCEIQTHGFYIICN